MVLPEYAFTIRGGCNCRAIRWKASIPHVSRRPVNNYSKVGGTFPMTVMDHCNDCRRANGGPASVYMCIPAKYMTVSILKESDPNAVRGSNFASDASTQRYGMAVKPEDNDYSRRGPWLPAFAVLRPNLQTSMNSPFVRFYESSGDTVRTFCGRCGTPLMYAMNPMPEGWPEMYDVLIGTIDRDDLNHRWMKPEHHCFWDYGVNWVKDMVTGAANDIPIHPRNEIDVVAENPSDVALGYLSPTLIA